MFASLLPAAVFTALMPLSAVAGEALLQCVT